MSIDGLTLTSKRMQRTASNNLKSTGRTSIVKIAAEPAPEAREDNRTKIVYLACPYTDRDPRVRRWRFHMATAAAATLVKRGVVVFSPVTMTHPMDVVLAGENTLGSEFWGKFDEAFMDKCSEMIILEIDGWDSSSGIRREIEFFKKSGKPISFMQQSEIESLPRESALEEPVT